MNTTDDSLQLLLAMDDGRAALGDALSTNDALHGERPGHDGNPSHYYQSGGDPNDLAAQGWAIIAPVGPVGDRLVALARPLIAKRAEDQGLDVKDVKVLRVAPEERYKTPAGAAHWSKSFYDDKSGASDDVPLYQLILGDLDQVPLAIQQYQSVTGRVGRVHFDAESGYEAYFDKLLRWEKAPARTLGRVVVHTAHDDSGALRVGHEGLIKPLLDLMNKEKDKGRFSANSIVVGGGEPLMPDIDGFLRDAEAPEPGVMFTMSQGVGGPRGGWKKEEDRRARQGAMHFGDGESLTGADLAERVFMPGGVWFMFACYGAGTPDVSAYQHWLAKLASVGRIKHAADVMSGLQGARPFIAALPQRVLANPNGPLAFIGHVDLAWTYSFQDASVPSKRRPGQFQRIIGPMLQSHRVGVAVSELTRTLASAETELVGLYDEDARTGASVEQAEGGRRAFLWMERNDLSGYVLLGDPAARLPVSQVEKKAASSIASSFGFAAPAPAVSVSPVSAPPAVDGDKLESAIWQVLIGDRSAKVVATELKLERAELDRLVEAYRTAGRAAIGLKG